ncbi:exodeoxyribonuclease-5 [Bradyrhizobium sp. Rc2d]|uniref:UvrD-helicase domain-containing protein n=1 Tax=Bradyrhizobium sp. Rc2d TaxID=1855321 RepID=UPI00088025DA|nr:UvrD-helicase domain-containing protein [Bradyrhizobium sp. Rc2d]SDG59962.1 exodeoxyribonuclease-5 [Bradyrhizobium sp. Rc2d]
MKMIFSRRQFLAQLAAAPISSAIGSDLSAFACDSNDGLTGVCVFGWNESKSPARTVDLLLARVREFVADLSAGRIAPELRVARPDGLSQVQRGNLATASAAIDEITCSTIHGFCQRLIKPYPAEADIDPGASVMDPNQADLSFIEIVDGWLRERLSGDQGGILAEMVLQSPGETVALIRKIAENLRRRRALSAPPVSPLKARVTAFRQATADFAAFIRKAAAVESETAVIVERLTEMMAALANGPEPYNALGSGPSPDLATAS